MKSVFSLLLLLWIVSTEAKFVITDGKCPEAVAQYTLKVEDVSKNMIKVTCNDDPCLGEAWTLIHKSFLFSFFT